jgi:hypothetical protein
VRDLRKYDKIENMIENYKKELTENKKITLKLKIISKANKTQFINIMDDNTIKLAVASVPEKGKANSEIISFLSKEFNVSKKDIKIISGKTSTVKLIQIKKEEQ